MQQNPNFLRHFRQLAGPFWNSTHKRAIRWQSALLILLTILQIVLAVSITEWNAALFNALEQRSMPGLSKEITLLGFIFIASMVVTTSNLIVKRKLQIQWRNWLTERVTGLWMHKGLHYQVTHIQSADHDNPDGRIAEDITIATENAVSLFHSLFYCLLMLVSFTKILWTLSGTVTLTVGQLTIPIYGHLVWIALVYASVASSLGWWIGRPLTEATNEKQSAEANYRFGLVKARENSQAIALIHGEENERTRLSQLFQEIIQTFNLQTKAWQQILLFTSGYSVLSMAFPVLLSSPRYILGSISLGALMQSAQAFQQLTSALSWPVDNMAGVAQWRASVERVLNLVHTLENLARENSKPDPHRIMVTKGKLSVLRFQELCLRTPNNDIIAEHISANIFLGERVLIIGDSSTSTKLFKAIAGLWPWGNGQIILPDGDPMFFMPPLPYLPDGTLRASICYPEHSTAFSQALLEDALKKAELTALIKQLEEHDEWEKVLSREQQQRLGAVRLLLNKPKWIFILEAFDSLQSEDEEKMILMLFKALPEAGIMSYSNHCTPKSACADAHQRQIIL